MSDGGLDAAEREVERRRKAARRARKTQEHAQLHSGDAPSPDDADVVEAGLGGALFALGVELARAHRYQEALAPAQEAVEILRGVQRSARVDVSSLLLPAEDILAVILT